VPGALGLFLRSKLYPLILGRVGRNVVFGVNVTIRHPTRSRSATTSSSTISAASTPRAPTTRAL
jgi:hypothetical protein